MYTTIECSFSAVACGGQSLRQCRAFAGIFSDVYAYSVNYHIARMLLQSQSAH